MSTTKINFNQIKGNTVNVLDFGANTTPGTTDMTAAIDAAIATGKDVVVDGVMATTGLHRLGGSVANSRQKMIGINGATLKKLSGTSYILDTLQGAEVTLQNIDINCNSLAGEGIWWRGHYSVIDNVQVYGGISTGYAVRFSGVNISTFIDLHVTGGGGINIDATGDAGAVGGYAMLYSAFYGGTFICTSASLQAIRIDGSTQCQDVSFNDIFFENAFASPSTAPAILISGGPTSGIHFKNLKGEIGTSSAPIISIVNSGYPNIDTYDIHFDGARIGDGTGGSTGAIFSLDSTQQVTIKGMQFHLTPNPASRSIITCYRSNYITAEDNCVYATSNDFTFFNDTGSNTYITERGNSSGSNTNFPREGTDVWNSTSSNILVINSQFAQSNKTAEVQIIGRVPTNNTQQLAGFIGSVASSSSRDIWGDGGISLAGDFYGVITIATKNSLAIDKDKFAQFYCQVSSTASSQSFVSIITGSDVELVANPNNTNAAQALTTNGKLGIQIGYGVAGTGYRYVTLFNRLGGSAINLYVHILRF